MSTSTPPRHLRAIVIGGGHAGLAASYLLKQKGIDHVVLERGRIGETWRTQRWDSFQQNTPNLSNVLPGDVYSGSDRDGFDTHHDFVRYLVGYAARHHLPVLEATEVIELSPSADGATFTAKTRCYGVDGTWTCDQVVIASGMQQAPRIPESAGSTTAAVQQIHSSVYKRPSDLPPGAVLVVGGAQSGSQIADELLAAGRKVFLSSSRVGRAMRRYRGKDCVEWLIMTGFFDQHKSTLPDPRMMLSPTPQVSGVGLRGKTTSYQQLHRDGATILGRFAGAEGGRMLFADDAAQNVRFADEVSAKLKQMIDGYIAQEGLDAPAPEHDEADVPDPGAKCASSITSLDLADEGISTVVWCTGFKGDLAWVKLPILDGAGQPAHTEGASTVPGIYYLGFPWLRRRASGNIYGVAADAEHIVGAMSAQLAPA